MSFGYSHNKEEALAQPAAECFGESSPACYAAQDDRYLYTANYHEGTILIYEITYEEDSPDVKSGPPSRILNWLKESPLRLRPGAIRFYFTATI